jgi:quercetin dioxygenase-like cupin family protein
MNQNILDQIEYPKSGILSKEILKNSKADVTLFCMAKGAEISEHTSTKSGFVHVIEGKGIFALKGEKIAMEPGVLIYMKESVIHSLEAKDNTSFLLILINGKG